MTSIYVDTLLGNKPKLKTEEEKEFYKSLKKEIDSKGKAQWEIPSD